jgi:Fe-S cluster assembly protein SufD
MRDHTTTMPVATSHDLYLARFDRFIARRGPRDHAWLTSVRKDAIAKFAALGFPTTRDEEWRFTNVAPIADTAFAEATDPPAVARNDIAPFVVRQLVCSQLVFVNGRFAPDLSSVRPLPAGAHVTSLAQALASDPGLVDPYFARCASADTLAFTALNTAFAEDGAFVYLPAGTSVHDPVHAIYFTTGAAPVVSHPRTIVVVGDNSQVKLIETYAGARGDVYFTNAVTEIVGGEHSVVEHYRVQRESFAAHHVSNTHIHLEQHAVFAQQSVTLGGSLVRNDITAALAARHVECTLNGLYLGHGRRLIDNHTTIVHAAPECASHELYKGMLDEQAHGVFNGKIFVRQDAQKTDAKQTNQVLLLSDHATINTKPQLEIYADDVKCTHGATVGQLDDESLFYLRARGIGEHEARAMLIHAFASDIIDRVAIAPLHDALEAALLDQLPKQARV